MVGFLHCTDGLIAKQEFIAFGCRESMKFHFVQTLSETDTTYVVRQFNIRNGRSVSLM
jgi:hypothetical protein